MIQIEVPKNYEYIFPTLDALLKLGGAGTKSEIFNNVKNFMNLSEEVLSIRHRSKRKDKDGTIYYVEDRSEAEYRADWARTYLRHYGLIENTSWGRWSLTSKSNLDELINLDEDDRKTKAKEIRDKYLQETAGTRQKRSVDSKNVDPKSSDLEPETDEAEEIDDDDLIDNSYAELDELEPNSEPTYTANEFLLDTSITPEELNRYEKIINRKKQIILAGSSGTGKTFTAQKFAKYLTSSQNGYVDLVQFHPSYTYEDFMRGLKPEIKDGNLT